MQAHGRDREIHSGAGRAGEERLTLQVLKKTTFGGFLYIRCATCGEVHAFMPRGPIKSSFCPTCGNHTRLYEEEMHNLRLWCECGSNFYYQTNIDPGEQFDVPCYNCGAPISVEWNSPNGRFEPMQERRWKKKGRRK